MGDSLSQPGNVIGVRTICLCGNLIQFGSLRGCYVKWPGISLDDFPDCGIVPDGNVQTGRLLFRCIPDCLPQVQSQHGRCVGNIFAQNKNGIIRFYLVQGGHIYLSAFYYFNNLLN